MAAQTSPIPPTAIRVVSEYLSPNTVVVVSLPRGVGDGATRGMLTAVPGFGRGQTHAEVSIRFSRVEDLDDALPPHDYRRAPLPRAAAFLAGKAFLDYRRNSGTRSSTLPDFFIGAHAAVDELALLTRDATRYRTYFPTVRIIAPEA